MIQLDRTRARPVVDRSSDRLITLAAIGLALAYLVAAFVAMLLPPELRRGLWLPLHLALAGAATTAIAGVMPFFSAAFAAAPPTDARLRAGAVVAVAVGAAAVVVGTIGNDRPIGVLGGILFGVGIVLIGIATAWPARRGLGPRGGAIRTAYLVALAEVAVGATLATLFLAGWGPSVEAWDRWKPAHAWLNLIGFVSLVIATTLLHFFPTVVGARIGAHTSARVVIAGFAAGPPLVALGFVLGADLVAQVGAALSIVGALALALYAWRIWRTKAPWRTDLGWHRFAMGGLVSAIAWLEVGMLMAAGVVLVWGAAPAAWSVAPVLGPIVVGWVGLSIVASATHLVPAIGPGDQAVHGRQRALLGRWSSLRLVLIDGGIALLTVGHVLDLGPLVVAGSLLVAAGSGSTVLLLAVAASIGWRSGSADRQ